MYRDNENALLEPLYLAEKLLGIGNTGDNNIAVDDELLDCINYNKFDIAESAVSFLYALCMILVSEELYLHRLC